MVKTIRKNKGTYKLTHKIIQPAKVHKRDEIMKQKLPKKISKKKYV